MEKEERSEDHPVVIKLGPKGTEEEFRRVLKVGTKIRDMFRFHSKQIYGSENERNGQEEKNIISWSHCNQIHTPGG